jgi:Oligosaccharyltransferase subunit Ribophorin II
VGSRPAFLAPNGGNVAVDVLISDASSSAGSAPLLFSSLLTLQVAAPSSDGSGGGGSTSSSAGSKPQEILYSKPLLHASDVALAPLPEIVHRFRAEERQVPAVVGLAVAGGVGALLVAFAGRGAAALAGERGVSVGLPGVVFLLLLAAVFAVDTAYFLELPLAANAFQAIALKSALALLTIVVGRYTLRALRDAADK